MLSIREIKTISHINVHLPKAQGQKVNLFLNVSIHHSYLRFPSI